MERMGSMSGMDKAVLKARRKRFAALLLVVMMVVWLVPGIVYGLALQDTYWVISSDGVFCMFHFDDDGSADVRNPPYNEYDPTCTEGAYTEYTATVVYGSETFTATKKVESAGDNKQPLGHDFSTISAEQATCVQDGHITYYVCNRISNGKTCGLVSITNNSSAPTQGDLNSYNSAENQTGIKIKALGHDMKDVPAKQATCEDDGNILYYKCSRCDHVSLDKDGNNKADLSHYANDQPGGESDGVKTKKYGHDYDVQSIDDWTWAADYSSASVKLTCKNNNTHTITVNASQITNDGKTAKCTEDVELTYTATASYDGKTFTNQKKKILTKLNHNYNSAPSWEWTGVTEAWATFTCANDNSHQQKVKATITDDGATAKCTEDVTKTYTATVVFEGHTYTDPKKETLKGTNHQYGAPSWEWTGFTEAWAVFTCTNDNSHQERVKATITDNGATAKCTEDVKKIYTATVQFGGTNYTDPKEETLKATDHNYGAPSWEWTGFTEAWATFTCANDNSHQERVKATITDNGATAKCTEDVKKIYTATVSFGGTTYTDPKEETLKATNHNYGKPSWEWTGFTEAWATFTCANDNSHQEKVKATITDNGATAKCTEDVKKIYTASVNFGGTTYTDPKEETLKATDHNYGDPSWEWTGFTEAWATFTCANDNSHQEKIKATITDNGVTAKCTEDVKKIYTATVQFGETTYTDPKEETLKAINHKYGDPTWTWTGYSEAKATFICENDNSHKEEIKASIIDNGAEPTCEQDAEKVYTATANFNNQTYTDKKNETLKAPGHNWTAWSKTKDPTCYAEGEEERMCQNEGCGEKDTRPIAMTEHNWSAWTRTKAPKCGVKGEDTRTCQNEGCGKKQTRDVDALEHLWGDWTVTKAAACGVAGEETRTCKRAGCNGKETRETEALEHLWGDWAVTKAPTCEAAGEETRTCTRTGCSGKETREVKALGHDWGEWVVTKEPTCQEKGEETRTCQRTGCGKKETRETAINPQGHKMIYHPAVEPDCEHEGNIAYWECTYCGLYFADESGSKQLTKDQIILPMKEHTWDGDWKETKAPTCLKQGVETRECIFCGAKETRAIPALGHDWSEWKVTKEAAPGQQGEEMRECQRDGCDAKETRPIADPTGGKMVFHPAVEADCDHEGSREYWENTETGEIFADAAGAMPLSKDEITIPKKEHSWGAWQQTKAPTCEAAGEETRKCSACEDTEKREVAALGHDWSDWAEVKAATCTEKGEESRACQRKSCGVTEKRDIAALGHDWSAWTETKAPTCEAAGEESRACQRKSCDAKETREVAAKGHSWGEWALTAAPTCTAAGEEIRKCANCKLAETRETEPAGHVWGEWTMTVEPTCLGAGEESRTCANCRLAETRTVDPLDHNWGEWMTVTPATVHADGLEERVCQRDPSHIETRPIARTHMTSSHAEEQYGGIMYDITKGKTSLSGDPVLVHTGNRNFGLTPAMNVPEAVVEEFQTIGDTGLKLWIPGSYTAVDKEEGSEEMLCYFLEENKPRDGFFAMAIETEYKDISEYQALVEKAGGVNPATAEVNGMQILTYGLGDREAVFAAVLLENGELIEFSFFKATEEEPLETAGKIIATLQAQ